MRLSPDGKSEVVDMMVPVTGSRSRVVIISGIGLPTKIGVGAVDLPDGTWLEIENRFGNPGGLAYDTVEHVHGGMIALDAEPIRGRDQTYSARSGATFGIGLLDAAPSRPGTVEEERREPADRAVWMVTRVDGKALLVAPFEFDSFQIRDAIARSIHGEFCVEMITAGTMHAAGELAVPGWRLVKQVSLSPQPTYRC